MTRRRAKASAKTTKGTERRAATTAARRTAKGAKAKDAKNAKDAKAKRIKAKGGKTAARKAKAAKTPTPKASGAARHGKSGTSAKSRATATQRKSTAPKRASKGPAAASKAAPRATRDARMTGKPGRTRRTKAQTPSPTRASGQPSATTAPHTGSSRRPGHKLGLVGTVKRVARRAARGLLRTISPGTGRSPHAAGPRAAATPRKSPRGLPRGIVIRGAMAARYDEVLSRDALAFVAELHRRFDATRQSLLAARHEQQSRYDAGALPDFPIETAEIRAADWKVAPIPRDLMDRRVEITGPVDRKMVINALNSGANVYMADFEDANSPTWANNIEGQINLRDRWAGSLAFTDPTTQKDYRLDETTAVLVVRPRGWHLGEVHMTVDGEAVAASLFDFGLYLFHNAQAQIDQGTAPYFYLPKLETRQEARLWNDVFVHAQNLLGLPVGTIKATVLIETLPAAFEMDEILWELRDHVAGLNAGRWDYIFSFIKKFANNPDYVLPDRAQVVMGDAFLRAYALLLIRTCHHRGAFAMGGMAAQIPIRGDARANDAAFAKVRADKEREAREGHDGTWVAHPDLVPIAKEVFDAVMPQPNQLDRLREDVQVTRDDLLRIHDGTRTEAGFRANIRVGVQYIEAWLRGRGAVPIYNLMEDAATAEISRAQIWQWVKYGVTLDTGVIATADFFRRALTEEMAQVRQEVGAEAYESGRFAEAIALFSQLSLADAFAEFLTIPAYRLL